MPKRPLDACFRRKDVNILYCAFCRQCVCIRGMRAVLLADTAVQLYSTDLPPDKYVSVVNQPFKTEKCKCLIREAACQTCGNIVGYYVVQPCRPCLEACNNGHFFMYYPNCVDSMERLDSTGMNILIWEHMEDEEQRRLECIKENEVCLR